MQEYAQPAVGERREAVPAAFDAFHAHVQPFGRAVRRAAVMAGQDLGAPRGQGAPEGSDLMDVVVAAADDGLVQQQRRFGGIVGQQDIPH